MTKRTYTQAFRIEREHYTCPSPGCRQKHNLLIVANAYDTGDLAIMVQGEMIRDNQGIFVLDFKTAMLLRMELSRWLDHRMQIEAQRDVDATC